MSQLRDVLVYMFAVLPLVVISGAATVNPSDLEAPPRYTNPNEPAILCLMCSPGTYLKFHCTQNLTNSVCKECETGKFSRYYNQAESCEACRTPEKGCPIRNARLVFTCNSTTNNFCVCNTGYYYHSKSQNPMTEYEGDCELHSPCPIGEGVKVRGTADNNTRCESCPAGTFSDEESSTAACRSYKNCSAGTVQSGGTRKTDISCKPSDKDGQTPVVAIVLSVFAVIVILGIIVALVLWRRRRKKNAEKPDGGELPEMENGGANSNKYLPVSSDPPPDVSVIGNGVERVSPADPPPDVSVIGNGVERVSPADPPPAAPVPVASNGVDTVSLEKPNRRRKVPWEEVSRFLSSQLCGTKDYKMALRSIMGKSGYKGGDALITEHSMNNPRNVKEVIYLVLIDWTKKSPCTLDMVIAGLREQNLNQLVKDLQQLESVKMFIGENEESTTSTS